MEILDEKGFEDRVEARPYLKKRINDYKLFDSTTLMEVELHKLNDNPINHNEDAAWEIIKGAFHNFLFNDPYWHFFYEDKYNLIRCSQEFYDELVEYLKETGVEYAEKGEWIDGSQTVEGYKMFYMHLFHQFSMMALEEYHTSEIGSIFDRLAHCFLNHQYFALKRYREIYAVPSLWESELIFKNAMYRAHYTGRCDGISEFQEWYEKKSTKQKVEQNTEKKEVGWIRRFIERLRSYTLTINIRRAHG